MTVVAKAARFQESGVTGSTGATYRPAAKRRETMAVRVEQFMCRTDNFGVLVHDDKSGRTLLVDAPQEAPILEAIERTGWKPDLLIVTHHHGDHVEANLVLKQKFNLTIIGPKAEAAKIPGIDQKVGEGDTIPFGAETITVMETPGHTAGHVSYLFPDSGVAVRRRHAVCHRLRPAARMQAACDVRIR